MRGRRTPGEAKSIHATGGSVNQGTMFKRQPLTSWVLVAGTLLAGAGVGCHSRPIDSAPASRCAAGDVDVVHASALSDGREPFGGRAEALDLARTIALRASSASDLATKSACAALAGGILERAFRSGHRESDGRQALDLLRVAAQSPDPTFACHAAMRAAHLAGELAHDPSLTYAELDRARTSRLATAAADTGKRSQDDCARRLDADLHILAAYQPPAVHANDVVDTTEAGLLTESPRAALPSSPASVEPRIERVETWPGPDTARVVLILNRPTDYRVDDENGPSPRTSLDFDGVGLALDAPRDVAPNSGIIRHVRMEATSTGTRVAIELDGAGYRRVFPLTDPYRVVVDVARRRPGVRSARAPTVLRVVLDPGHGGKDAGATGLRGLREKDVTLDVARRAAPALTEQGMEVMLTRDDDRLPTLEERTARANAFGADLFVFIHCNASETKGHRGVETYVLDATRDELAARVAARENSTPMGHGDELAAVLNRIRFADQVRNRRTSRTCCSAHRWARCGPDSRTFPMEVSTRQGSTFSQVRACRPSSSRSVISRIRRKRPASTRAIIDSFSRTASSTRFARTGLGDD